LRRAERNAKIAQQRILLELGPLFVMIYILYRQGWNLKYIGLTFKFTDLPWPLLLFAVSMVVGIPFWVIGKYFWVFRNFVELSIRR
jgi:hypothetical protein